MIGAGTGENTNKNAKQVKINCGFKIKMYYCKNKNVEAIVLVSCIHIEFDIFGDLNN